MLSCAQALRASIDAAALDADVAAALRLHAAGEEGERLRSRADTCVGLNIMG